MTTDRTTLALAACQGLTNEELAKRGPGGYLKMRARAAAAKAAHLPVHEPSDAGPPDGDSRGWALVEGRK